jgi:hypothetical protein
MTELRPYQINAVAEINCVIAAGKRRPLLVAPTGAAMAPGGVAPPRPGALCSRYRSQTAAGAMSLSGCLKHGCLLGYRVLTHPRSLVRFRAWRLIR